MRMKASNNWQCQECGEVTQRLAVHHVLPVEDTNDPDEMERRCFCLPPYTEETQLQVLCYRCHKAKHEYRQGTHEERERQRAERMRRNASSIDLEDGFDF